MASVSYCLGSPAKPEGLSGFNFSMKKLENLEQPLLRMEEGAAETLRRWRNSNLCGPVFQVWALFIYLFISVLSIPG